MRLHLTVSEAQAEHLINACENAEMGDGVDYYEARPVTVLVTDAVRRARRLEQKEAQKT